MGEADQDGVMTPIRAFDEARRDGAPAERLARIRTAARAFRESFLAGSPVLYYRTFDMFRAPYPARYGLRDAFRLPIPLLHIINRLFVIQFSTSQGVKTLLGEPLDHEGNSATPFFRRMAGRFGGFDSPGRRLLYPALNEVESCLARVGIRPEDVDYLTYDHLHTQDLRKWLGPKDGGPVFPNAKLLVTREEWQSVKALIPLQRDWYAPGGTEGIDESRIIFLDQDVLLGNSVALIRTPGHTRGNHSIIALTDEGPLVTSENGVAPDAYAPENSRIPGVRRYARETGMEFVLNGNTLEGSVDQYISMALEREIAGPSTRNPDFYNIVCSSEMTPHWLSPGLRPTFRFGELEFGRPTPSEAKASR